MNSRITRASTALAAVLLVAGGAVAPANAAELNTSCDTEFGELTSATNAAKFTSNRKDQDRAGLLSKVTDAQWKYQHNKVDGALQKLADYDRKLDSLVLQNKVEGAAGMYTALGAAVACVTP